MPPNRATAAIRRVVAARAKSYCEYCRCSERFAKESFTIEHIKPRSKGGETVLVDALPLTGIASPVAIISKLRDR